MKPVFENINQNALQTLLKGEINYQVFFERTSDILKEFMAKHTRKDTIKVFLDVSGIGKEEREKIKSPKDIPLSVLITAFMVSEISVAFQIVFLLFLPFGFIHCHPFLSPTAPSFCLFFFYATFYILFSLSGRSGNSFSLPCQ
jgi:flagellar biosynthesis protein FliP